MLFKEYVDYRRYLEKMIVCDEVGAKEFGNLLKELDTKFCVPEFIKTAIIAN